MRKKIATIAAAAALAAVAAVPAAAAPPDYPGGQCVKNGVQAVAGSDLWRDLAKGGLTSTIILDHVNDDADFTEGALMLPDGAICDFK